MNTAPRASIVIPLFNDEEYVTAALDSCLAQTLADIEIICVDDASTDTTASIVEEYAARDLRITLIKQPTNRSAFQARRVGVQAANAPFVMFLDGDDELTSNAVHTALAAAKQTGADVVGFGISIVAPHEGFPTRFESALQPQHRSVSAPAIISTLFPAGEVTNGHLWRYCFATRLLSEAYQGVSPELTFYRANDLPITFLALARASKYVSVEDRLYLYHFRRGTSGHAIGNIEHFRFLLSGVEPINSIDSQVNKLATESTDPQSLLSSYDSARLHIIGNVLRYCIRDTSGTLRDECIRLLIKTVGAADALRAAAAFCPEARDAITKNTAAPSQPARVQNVLLTTMHLETGGLQSVLLEHVELLHAQGYQVTVAVLRDAGRDVTLPVGVDLVEVAGEGLVARIDHWLRICHEYSIDAIVDHHILYNDNWPWFTLAALSAGVPTIGWVHNFALRPLFEGNQRISFLQSHMRLLLRVATLSPADVAFWKLQGIQNVVYLPNPPTPLAREAIALGSDRQLSGNRIELAWWGRLDRVTKQVMHLIDLAAGLKVRDVDFRLTIIGPDSKTLTAMDLRKKAESLGVNDRVDFLGEQSSSELLTTLKDVDLLVSASAIEGYQLTIIEAQALGIPVVMYDLPWLATVQDNRGLVAVEPGSPGALADAVARVAADGATYQRLSHESRAYAHRTIDVDLADLLDQLLNNELPAAYSPEPTVREASVLMPLLVQFAERNMTEGGRGVAQIESEITALRRERDRANRKLKDITDGPSFRVGRLITSVPRKAHAFLARRRAGSAAQRPGFNRSKSDASAIAPPPPLRRDVHATSATRVPTPDVSVVVPVYNSEPWLDDCLSSVLAQTGVTIELICINDGSTDGSREILQNFADADPRVTIIDQANSGQSVGRNVGIDSAAGRYVIFLDSDDYWPYDSLSTLVKDADDESLDMLLFDCLTFRDGDIDEKTWKWYANYYQRARTYRDIVPGEALMASMRRGRDYRPHVGLYMARTEYIQSSGVRFIPGIVHQDNPYTFRLLLNATRAAHRRMDVYARRIRPGSTITALSDERSARGYFLAYLEMSRELANRRLDERNADGINNIVDYAYEGARKKFALISDHAAKAIQALDASSDAQAVFESLREGA